MASGTAFGPHIDLDIVQILYWPRSKDIDLALAGPHCCYAISQLLLAIVNLYW